MSKHQLPDTEQLRHMNALLETGLALPEEVREAWLQALPPPHRALLPSLRVLLQRASEETDRFMRRSVDWARVPLDAGSPERNADAADTPAAAAPAPRAHSIEPSRATPLKPDIEL